MPEIFVYALASRPTGRIALTGVTGEPLRAVHIGRLDAIVSLVRARPAPTDQNLRRYDRILFALWQRTPALLPARFGSSARDQAELERMVGARNQTLRRSLRAVRNRAQMTVRILEGSGIGDQGSKALSQRSPIPNPRSLNRGAQFLRARAEAERRANEVPVFSALRPAVRRWIRSERVEKRRGVASIYHLVPRRSADRYRDAIQRAAASAGVRIIVTGPWPPYAFADAW